MKTLFITLVGLTIMFLSQKVALAQCTPEQTEAMRSAGMAETQIQAACPSSSQCTSNQRKAMQNAGMSREQIEAACNSRDTNRPSPRPSPDSDCLNKCVEDVIKCNSDLITSDPYGTLCESLYEQCQIKCKQR